MTCSSKRRFWPRRCSTFLRRYAFSCATPSKCSPSVGVGAPPCVCCARGKGCVAEPCRPPSTGDRPSEPMSPNGDLSPAVFGRAPDEVDGVGEANIDDMVPPASADGLCPAAPLPVNVGELNKEARPDSAAADWCGCCAPCAMGAAGAGGECSAKGFSPTPAGCRRGASPATCGGQACTGDGDFCGDGRGNLPDTERREMSAAMSAASLTAMLTVVADMTRSESSSKAKDC
mmetsp:Transcript_23783/g.68838  ORF Transcript_23783/g.68838 Transcript_23783/m.68838 type:complete len:231 (-) Transcript_23783:15-707(-)